MKLTKEELIAKVQGSEVNDELKISLLEDISDSFETIDRSKFVEVEKYDELKDKYIKRFTEGAETEEAPDTHEPETPAPEEIRYEDLFEEVK